MTIDSKDAAVGGRTDEARIPPLDTNLREWVEAVLSELLAPLDLEAAPHVVDTLTQVVECRARELAAGEAADAGRIAPEEDAAAAVCEACGGAGTVPIGEHFVTHDMALDAGEPAMEGMSCGVEMGPCDACGGAGLIAVVAAAPNLDQLRDRVARYRLNEKDTLAKRLVLDLAAAVERLDQRRRELETANHEIAEYNDADAGRIALTPSDPWPEGISNGLSLPCSDCGVVPRFDYHVEDAFWRRYVPDAPARLSVVCLPCLDRRCGGDGLADALVDIQWTGTKHTVVLHPTRILDYSPEAASRLPGAQETKT